VALTAKRVARLLVAHKKKKPGRYLDGHGLVLQIKNPNNASWLLRYERNGEKHWLGLGPLHTVGLAEARERAKAARLQLLDGIDPLLHKRAQRSAQKAAALRSMTFRQCAEGYIDMHQAEWRNAKHGRQWLSTLAAHVYPLIGDINVGAVDVPTVLRVLEQKVPAFQNRPEGKFWMDGVSEHRG
jgi:hypothetical protein